jgi:hypothetical protein
MPRTMFCVSVTRGRKTIYRYGSKMKDAVDLLKLKAGERFKYARYEHGGITAGEWGGTTWHTI